MTSSFIGNAIDIESSLIGLIAWVADGNFSKHILVNDIHVKEALLFHCDNNLLLTVDSLHRALRFSISNHNGYVCKFVLSHDVKEKLKSEIDKFYDKLTVTSTLTYKFDR